MSLNSLIEPREKRAVSDPEKKAEKHSRTKMRTILMRTMISKATGCYDDSCAGSAKGTGRNKISV